MPKPTIRNDKKQTKEQSGNFLDSLYESFNRRFNRTPSLPEPIVYEFTNDRASLHQYYRLRETMYRKVFRTDKFVGEEDVHDKLSHVLIARRGKLVIGGCRLTIREADENFLLPMESQDFKLRHAFSELPLGKVRHSEVSRFAVMDDDSESMDIMLVLSQLAYEKCVDLGVAYSFLKSTLPMARNWRKIIQAHCGQQNVRIRTDIKVPENPIHPEVTWYITEVPLPAAEALPNEPITKPVEAAVH